MYTRMMAIVAAAAIACGLPVAARADGPRTTASGDVEVVTTSRGSTVSWRPDTMPMGDARPMVVVGGVVLGPALDTHGRTFRLRVPGRRLSAKDVSIRVGARTVAGPRVRHSSATTSIAAQLRQPTSVLSPDPGATGRYATTEFTYTRPSVTLADLATPVEVKAVVVMPRHARGRRPVVLFLHGRHATCYSRANSFDDWPCPKGSTPIASYRGYLQTQRLLASQGFVTVSISANGINAQDGALVDGGAADRAALVRDHLALLAQWAAGAGPTAGSARRDLAGHLAMNDVVTVGHSRGGEGVVRAAIEQNTGDPFRIVGQVLIAPTDFGEQVAPGVPTTVLLPECDGDVSDLQGQQYVDESRGAVSGDRALRTAVMIVGADHNFFNAAWTPGGTKAPADDDWSGARTDVCSPTQKVRLTPAGQRAVGATYVAAAVRAYTHTDSTSVHLLDGSAVRAASAGSAITFASAIGGHRAALFVPGSSGSVPVTHGRMTAVGCGGATARRECAADGTSPHWLTYSQFSGTLEHRAVRLSWRAAGASARLSGAVRAGVRAHVDVRAIVTTGSRLALRVGDREGHTVLLAPDRTATTIPATGGVIWAWAQDLRFTLPRKGLDRGAISRVDLVSASATGTAVVLDAWATNDQLATSSVSPATVPRVNIADQSVSVPAGGATATVRVPLTVQNPSDHALRIWVQLSSWTATDDLQGRYLTVPAGASTVDFPLTVTAEQSDPSDPPETPEVVVRAISQAEVGDYAGAVTVRVTGS